MDLAFIRSEAFADADPEQRGTWLCLLAHCADQENGGVIADCRAWKERKWLGTCKVTADEVARDSSLWSWDGESLVVHGYPTTEEELLKRKRKGGARGGKQSRKAPAKDSLRDSLKDSLPHTTKVSDKDPAKDPAKDPDNREEKKREEKKRAEQSRAEESPLHDAFDAIEQDAQVQAAMRHEPPPPPPKGLSDFLVSHPRCYIGRDEREDWEATYRYYGWDIMHVMYQRLAAKHDRIFKSLALEWLDQNTEDD